ncbi:acyl-CoA dehydrogenase [Ameyamaea chiangmaiensis NBRC 103196]|uniref:Acyl-CoA/acyl-ACP dehydrogenase n=1 Tax=Ameyamaea chiangmaiensis TaxID=442969 RepID=A0A850P8F0_9PROT|nr:acyl-CoA dehydrogenase family protein [Ameyamaea chiangmaiensis]MBS4074473.1 acyl-CoA/acyl-ACP dehydrogenase [Ameyamaea chiangmaiensis]NVN39263.1 acyl-CoA/acyl-ACP dehydrogenase [Ameyamaea chiangmaiensis]GBQ72161.1 acyl-CoA dehydrogenase [Ameyamaea chiangmaiensis NBRC 103196]
MDGSHGVDAQTRQDERLAALLPRFAERAAVHDRSGEIALETLDDLRQAGFLALAVPREKGGGGIGLRRTVDLVARVARADPSSALILAMQYLQTAGIACSSTWPDDLRDEVLGSVVRDGALVNALRVEPDLGTPARGGVPATRVRRAGGRWLLSGQKIFSTGSSALTWGLVWGVTDEPEPRVGQIVVPLDLPGVRIEKSWHHLGMRATGSHTFVFDDVDIPDRYLTSLQPVGAGSPETASVARWHAIIVAGLYDAIARSARDWLVDFLHSRVPSALGRSLATLPRFHSVLGEIDGLLLVNTALMERGLTQAEAGQRAEDDGQIKRIMTENAIAAVAKAIEVTGNPGLSQDNPLERHYRNVLCGRIHTPQADMVLESAGKHVLVPAP